VENYRREVKELMSEHTIGDVGTVFVVAGVGYGVVVLQAGGVGRFD